MLLLPGERNAISVAAKSHFLRSVDEPDNEKIVRGAHDGFIENLNVNLNLIRSRIRASSLSSVPSW
ncbi:hypothetical protein DL346_03535 [Paenibacillus montanisoli]|uniref:Uncharacterized protein n=1 Tax=Paenibacillus montanisoli TaxID=2081970 RepID=A0A328U718_9BACL|nr:hypothetical protein DL346_03535 [Paenibacillus montanisoli]